MAAQSASANPWAVAAENDREQARHAACEPQYLRLPRARRQRVQGFARAEYDFFQRPVVRDAW